jgi:hypothetical protein
MVAFSFGTFASWNVAATSGVVSAMGVLAIVVFLAFEELLLDLLTCYSPERAPRSGPRPPRTFALRG